MDFWQINLQFWEGSWVRIQLIRTERRKVIEQEEGGVSAGFLHLKDNRDLVILWNVNGKKRIYMSPKFLIFYRCSVLDGKDMFIHFRRGWSWGAHRMSKRRYPRGRKFEDSEIGLEIQVSECLAQCRVTGISDKEKSSGWLEDQDKCKEVIHLHHRKKEVSWEGEGERRKDWTLVVMELEMGSDTPDFKACALF